MNIATVDLLLLLVLLISVVIGAWRGLLYEVLSVIGWVAAFVLAQWWAVAAHDSIETSVACLLCLDWELFSENIRRYYGN